MFAQITWFAYDLFEWQFLWSVSITLDNNNDVLMDLKPVFMLYTGVYLTPQLAHQKIILLLFQF